ncbi:unnamed protein product [Fraxinus pennsylvanica]|uniref:Uncharacterized protein n=1 Tax=Fraxinus pennsylvanica TaxID=56036 RepID=A0AAD2AGU4_9LAMI|nr:unnamed protein product [Fraxinus pennsylvanica]
MPVIRLQCGLLGLYGLEKSFLVRAEGPLRQKAYVEALNLDSIFTPHLESRARPTVGNDRDALLSCIISPPRPCSCFLAQLHGYLKVFSHFNRLIFRNRTSSSCTEQATFKIPTTEPLQVSFTSALRTGGSRCRCYGCFIQILSSDKLFQWSKQRSSSGQ